MRRLIVHPDNPQARLIQQAAQALHDGDLLIMPTDACAVIAASMAHKSAVDRLRAIRQLNDRHLLTLLCPDLSALATYAKVDDVAFRFLKAWTPGPYTFILNASKQVPRRLWHPSRKTIGLRVPEHPVAMSLLQAFGEPLLSSSLIWPGESLPMHESDEIAERFADSLEVFLDSGHYGLVPTTVIDLTSGEAEVIREGAGSLKALTIDPWTRTGFKSSRSMPSR